MTPWCLVFFIFVCLRNALIRKSLGLNRGEPKVSARMTREEVVSKIPSLGDNCRLKQQTLC